MIRFKNVGTWSDYFSTRLACSLIDQVILEASSSRNFTVQKLKTSGYSKRNSQRAISYEQNVPSFKFQLETGAISKNNSLCLANGMSGAEMRSDSDKGN